MSCCDPFTGECNGEGHGCAAHTKSWSINCCHRPDCLDISCPGRPALQPVVTHNADGPTVTEWRASSPLATRNGGEQVDAGLPIVSFDQPCQWLRDLFFRGIFWLAVAASSVIAIGCVGYIAQKVWASDASHDIH